MLANNTRSFIRSFLCKHQLVSKRLENLVLSLTSNPAIKFVNTTMSEPKTDPETQFKDDKVYVQNDKDRKMLTLSFQYSANGKVRVFNLFRRQDEKVSDTLRRIQNGIIKLSMNKKTPQVELDIKVELMKNGQILDYENTIAKDAWHDGAILTINDRTYEVRSDFPQVELLTLPTYNMHNSIMMPIISLKNCDIKDCKFTWQRQLTKVMRDELALKLGVPEDHFEFEMGFYWHKLGEGFFYSPTDDDIGKKLRIICQPTDGTRFGPPVTTITNNPIEVGPSSFPFEKRHELTKSFNENTNEFRILTYNILADLYADSDYSREVLFSYCPSHALQIDYRRQILLREISGYHSDIMCIQEMDKKEYTRIYSSFFKQNGDYSSQFNTKGDRVAEGLGTFYRNSKFELVESHATMLSALISCGHDPLDIEMKPDDHDPKIDAETVDTNDHVIHPILGAEDSEYTSIIARKLDGIGAAIRANPSLYKRFMDRQTILQTTLVRRKHKPNSYLLIANTHLYFAPDADHVRLLQASVCLKYIEFLLQHYNNKLKSLRPENQDIAIGVVLCGDMNSSPDCGLYKLARTGSVLEDLKDWTSNDEEAVSGLRVDTSLRFESAYQNIDYTNYTPQFNGCLDYIYYQCEQMECKSTLPLPEHELVIAGEGIPSLVFPSDHLALVADLKFISP